MTTEKIIEISIVSVVTLFGGGIGLAIYQRGKEKKRFVHDEDRILKFFFDNSKYDFYNTYRIASAVNLTDKRVRKVCSNSKRISRNQKEKESWQLNHEFSN